MNKEEKIKLVNSVSFWGHTIDFGDDVITTGRTSMDAQKVRLSAIPKNLKNKTVLDIGCWDGFFSFECEKRGADVLAIDNMQQEEFIKSKYKKKINGRVGFKVAKKILNSEVKYKEMDFYKLENINRQFDIVLFLGVLYHLKNPYKAFKILNKITKKLLITESHYIKDNKYPMMRFYRGSELNNDTTNWWGPNIKCILAMLKSSGFKRNKVFRKFYTGDNRVIIISLK